MTSRETKTKRNRLISRLTKRSLRATVACLVLLTMVVPPKTGAYAVLAHETVIDAAWETHLKPVLKARFPDATEDQLSGAQAFAYGGSIIQDMGYYPYGSHLFSDLTHYLRSGDFVQALLRDAKDLDEYAFALGALSHYAGDNDGHRIGTNRAVPVLYPRLRKKYGDPITYEQDPLAHIKTEFGFDVVEVAQETYAPESYHDFIGFEVSQDLLDRAFLETYGLALKDVLVNEERALDSYRHAVSKTIPKATKVAWSLKGDEIKKELPGITRRKFLYNLSRANYQKEWGKGYQRPTWIDAFLAFLYRLLPKVGPLRVLQFKTPTPETQAMFRASFNATLEQYEKMLDEEKAGNLRLANDNFDVGEATGPGVYALNDKTHALLMNRLAENKFAGMPAELRAELLKFYSDTNAGYATKHDKKKWAKLQAELAQLKEFTATAANPAAP